MSDLFADDRFALIDQVARGGEPCIVRLGSHYARAYWTSDKVINGAKLAGMWAYDFGADDDSVHQIDFEPTHYAPLQIVSNA